MLQYKTKEATSSKGAMDIKNCRIKKAKFKDEEGEYFYGLNIMGRKENQEFYSLVEKDIDGWYDCLTPM